MVRIQVPLPSLGGKSSTGSDPQALPSKNAPDRNFGRFTWYCGVMATGSLEKGEVRPGIESRGKLEIRAPSGRERNPRRRIIWLKCSVVQCAAQPKSLTLARGGHGKLGPRGHSFTVDMVRRWHATARSLFP